MVRAQPDGQRAVPGHLRGDEQLGANHGALSYGHVGAELITLVSMLRIPVYMHNVSEERAFRPSAWTAFGAMDPQGADFRTCANFGPLYGK